MSTVNYWHSNVDYKQSALTTLFGYCAVLAAVAFMFVIAFGNLALDDIALLPLILLTLVAAFPYVPVATRNADSAAPRVLTARTYREQLKNASPPYKILSSRLAVMQPIYAAMCVMSLLLVAAYKILGEKIVGKKLVIAALVIQVPFNPLVGFNPLATMLLGIPESKFVTHANITRTLAPSDGPGAMAPTTNARTNGTPGRNVGTPSLASNRARLGADNRENRRNIRAINRASELKNDRLSDRPAREKRENNDRMMMLLKNLM